VTTIDPISPTLTTTCSMPRARRPDTASEIDPSPVSVKSSRSFISTTSTSSSRGINLSCRALTAPVPMSTKVRTPASLASCNVRRA
jgi:hypothetical protein